MKSMKSMGYYYKKSGKLSMIYQCLLQHITSIIPASKLKWKNPTTRQFVKTKRNSNSKQLHLQSDCNCKSNNDWKWFNEDLNKQSNFTSCLCPSAQNLIKQLGKCKAQYKSKIPSKWDCKCFLPIYIKIEETIIYLGFNVGSMFVITNLKIFLMFSPNWLAVGDTIFL